MSLFFPTLTLVREFGSTLRLSSRLILTAEYLLMEALRMEVRKINIILICCLWEFQMTLSSKEARRIGWESHVDEELKREAPVCLCCGGVIAWWDDISVIPGLTLDLPALSSLIPTITEPDNCTMTRQASPNLWLANCKENKGGFETYSGRNFCWISVFTMYLDNDGNDDQIDGLMEYLSRPGPW